MISCVGPKVDARILSEEGSDGEKGHILPFGEGGPERSPHFTGEKCWYPSLDFLKIMPITVHNFRLRVLIE